MLHGLVPRPYQQHIFEVAKSANTLVVLPTGLGKTAIALLLAAQRLVSFPNKKIVFLAPTKPLVEQQLSVFKESLLLPDDDFALFTGTIAPEKRHRQWLDARVIFSTPQALENDVLGGKISFHDVVLLIVDEAHRATGDYAYTFLAKKYIEQATHSRIVGLSASPGSDKETIKQVCAHLFIEKIEYRKTTDADVAAFTKETKIVWDEVVLTPDITSIIGYLQTAYDQRLQQVTTYGFLPKQSLPFSKTALLALQRTLHGKINTEENAVELLHSISLLAQCLKLSHALELAQTQSLYALYAYISSILTAAKLGKTKAAKSLAVDPLVLGAFAKSRDIISAGKEHPKLNRLSFLVNEELAKKQDAKIIIFTQFRDTAVRLQKEINASTKLFFGQAKKNGEGLSQKEQKNILQQFRAGDFSVLIATSVAEEGLDIPSVDHVFFYEPIPSAIRSVQRRGRTGRQEKGFVTVLIAKGTRDEINRWSSFHKEKRMYTALDDKKLLTEIPPPAQKKLSSFSSSHIQIVADFREKGSPVLKSLLDQDIDLELKQLQVGDFVLSKDVCVEYKRMDDFVSSIVDGRLLSQLRSLAQYAKPVLILEGEEQFASLRQVDQAAVLGMYATIVTSYKIPLLRTFSPHHTAKMLIAIAKQEQEEHKTIFSFHSAKPLDKGMLQEYVVGSFPQIGGALAKALLEHFDSVQAIVTASKEELRAVPLIGEKKAEELCKLFSQSYARAKEDI
jgi:Fanconi anemia group M protein